MQPMQLCLFSGRQFEPTFENAQWEKSNKCSQCNHELSRAGHLRRHLKTHTGEKSNKCDQCTIGQGPLKRAHSDLPTQPLILSASKYFRQIYLPFYPPRRRPSTFSEHCTMCFRQWRIVIRVFGTFALILWPSKYFRQIYLSFYPHPNISDRFPSHFIFVGTK